MKHTLEDWLVRLDQALEYRRTYGRESEWALLEAMYANLPNSGAENGPNLIEELGDALVSRLGVGNPAIGISPSSLDPRSVETYPIVQAVDNWLMTELEIADIMQDVILHAFLWGRGIVKIGYDSEYGFAPRSDVGLPEEPMGLTLTQFSRRGLRLEHGPARPGMPWILPVLPHDFLVPWGVKYLRWAPWCAHRIVRHIDDFRADTKYRNKHNVEPNMSMEDFVESYTKLSVRRSHRNTFTNTLGRTSMGPKNAEFIELWEIHSAIDGKVVVISDQNVHRVDDDMMQVDGLPFVSGSFVRHPRTFWSTPQADYLKIHQAEQSDISAQASKQRRINAFKLLMKKGMMDIEEKEKLLSPDIGVVAEVNPNADKDDIFPVPQANNFQLFNEAEFARRNARESIGFSRNQLGEFDTSSRRTATEVNVVRQGSDFRMDRRSTAITKMYTTMFRKLNQTVFKFWRRPRVIQISDGNWPEFDGEDIRGEYTYAVNFGLDKPRDPESRRMEAFQMYQFFAQDPYVDQVELRRYLARVFADIEFGRIFSDQALQQGAQAVNQAQQEQMALQAAQGAQGASV
tara:strand:+ start:3251 stop:4966 length:1716 start_codon:yes stop_codon:yes gene_type:complete